MATLDMRATKALTLLLMSSLGLMACQPTPQERPWNVLLITMDTTRADYIGAYGRDDATTPVLDALANRGYLFEWAHTSNPVTQAAHSTILTGMYPLAHGVRDNGLFRLPDQVDTLAEYLSREGYATGAAIGGFPLTVEFGTNQGFDFYDDKLKVLKQDHRGRPARQRSHNSWYDERPATHVNDAIYPFLEERAEDPQQPFFVWLHYWDPHEPHIAPPPYGQRYAHDPYQGEIAFTDAALGQMLDRLDAIGELDRTLIVVTSDHGESRREHNEMTHAFMAYESSMHVPLIIAVPETQASKRVAEHVGTVDIVPTVLDLLGLELPEVLQGRSLRGLMNDDPNIERNVPIYAESMSPKLTHGFGALRVLYDNGKKYIHGPIPELYDLGQDPAELTDLLAEDQQQSQAMHEQLQAVIDWNASDLSAAYDFDADTIERLAGLGYINMSGAGPQTDETLSTDGVPPQHGVAMINIAFRVRSLLSSGAYDPALPLVERLVASAPQQPYYRGQLAHVLAGLGQLDRAEKVIMATEQVNSANVDSFLAVPRLLDAEGENLRALNLANYLLEKAPSANGALLVAELSSDHEPKAIIEQLQAADERYTDNAAIKIELASKLLELGETEAAAAYLRPAMKSSPTAPAAHFALAQIYWQRQQTDLAFSRIEHTLTLAPQFCHAQNKRIEWQAQLNLPPSNLSEQCQEASQ